MDRLPSDPVFPSSLRDRVVCTRTYSGQVSARADVRSSSRVRRRWPFVRIFDPSSKVPRLPLFTTEGACYGIAPMHLSLCLASKREVDATLVGRGLRTCLLYGSAWNCRGRAPGREKSGHRRPRGHVVGLAWNYGNARKRSCSIEITHSLVTDGVFAELRTQTLE